MKKGGGGEGVGLYCTVTAQNNPDYSEIRGGYIILTVVTMVLRMYTQNADVYTDGSQWLQASTLSAGLHHAAVVANGNLFTWGSTKNGK